jgi:hypothetical protein
MIASETLERLCPRMSTWFCEMETAMQEIGRPLNQEEQVDALEIGVQELQKVRISALYDIPMPTDPELAYIATSSKMILKGTKSMTFGHCIVLKDGSQGDRGLITHELAHVRQFEEHLGIEGFMRSYLQEVLFPPYLPNGPMEKQAFRVAEEICNIPVKVNFKFWQLFREMIAALESNQNVRAREMTRQMYDLYRKGPGKFPNFTLNKTDPGKIGFQFVI